jgi:protein TonB
MDACRKAGLNKFSLQTGPSVTAMAPSMPAPALATVTSEPTKAPTVTETLQENPESPVTVVTKEQMSHFTMLDINDIFSYPGGAGAARAQPPATEAPRSVTTPSAVENVGSVAAPPDPAQETAPRIYELSELDQIPVTKKQGRPNYPFELRRSGVGGKVTVQFVVDANGDVRAAQAIEASAAVAATGASVENGGAAFATEAVAAVSNWKFVPGQKSGHAVDTNMHVEIVFSLNDKDRSG